MTMPNFLVIGAAKGGTTALHRYLKQHPQIYVSPQKELRFFPFENQRPDRRGPSDYTTKEPIITDIEEYRSFFAQGAGYPARGELSPLYLHFPRSAERIRHHVPDVKLIAILRQPAERAYSHYITMRRDGLERLDFAEAIAAEDRRVADGWWHRWHYRHKGFYAAQLKRYFDLFRREQLRVYLYEDYVADPVGLVQDLFRFLNVDDTFVPDMTVRHNESKLPRNRALQVYLQESRRTKDLIKQFVPGKLSRRIGDRLRRLNLTKPAFPEEMRRRLTEVYREDILKLQDMLGRDLSHWLK
jgi:Sulfotransferase family